MERIFAVLSCVLLVGVCAGQSLAQTPTITGVLDSSRTAVFQTPQQSCNANDIPDAMARAFRDSTGTVHMVAAGSEMFQNIGPTLDSVQHSCVVGHYSGNDPNPADFNDQTWVDSFYTFDGQHIVGLAHTEYHGWAHTGECTFKNGVKTSPAIQAVPLFMCRTSSSAIAAPYPPRQAFSEPLPPAALMRRPATRSCSFASPARMQPEMAGPRS